MTDCAGMTENAMPSTCRSIRLKCYDRANIPGDRCRCRSPNISFIASPAPNVGQAGDSWQPSFPRSPSCRLRGTWKDENAYRGGCAVVESRQIQARRASEWVLMAAPTPTRWRVELVLPANPAVLNCLENRGPKAATKDTKSTKAAWEVAAEYPAARCTPQPRAAWRVLAARLGPPLDPKQSRKTRKSENAKATDRSYPKNRRGEKAVNPIFESFRVFALSRSCQDSVPTKACPPSVRCATLGWGVQPLRDWLPHTRRNCAHFHHSRRRASGMADCAGMTAFRQHGIPRKP